MNRQIDVLPSIDQFCVALLSGSLPGVVPQVAMLIDIHDLYQAWCAKKGLHPAGQNVFAVRIKERHGVAYRRKRLIENGLVTHVRTLLYLAGPVYAAPLEERQVLGRQVEEFRAAAQAYSQSASKAAAPTHLSLVEARSP